MRRRSEPAATIFVRSSGQSRSTSTRQGQNSIRMHTPEPDGDELKLAEPHRGSRPDMFSDSESRQRANRALDAANFFLADVRDGLGPYLAVYLLTEQKWDEASIGVVMSVASFAGIVAQTPAGAVVDTTRAKRLVMVCAALIVAWVSLI